MSKKNSTKKILFGTITTILILGLVSCANNTNQQDEKVTESSTSNTEILSTFPIVDTNQGLTYNNSEQIDPPKIGEAFYGQDAQYTGNTPNYTDNGNGTITDNVTGLIWTQELSENSMLWEDAEAYTQSLTTGDITDWRLPNLDELWSIRDFSQGWPWVDTDYFHLVGDGSEGAQQHSWSSNYYLVDTDESKDNIAFIVNDWTGHIKAMDGKRFVRAVCGSIYGVNEYEDNGDGTVSDLATGLMWTQDDSGEAMNWEDALSYAENYEFAGYDDWRLPNVKELQNIVDYSGVFPTLDTSVFNISQIVNEAGNDDYPYFWTSTSNPYIDSNDEYGYWYAWYVAFGYAVGTDGEDLHGAGAVRFDTKHVEGADGPDGERYYNYVRLVRGGDVTETPEGNPATVKENRVVVFEDGDVGDMGLLRSSADSTNGHAESSDDQRMGPPPSGATGSNVGNMGSMRGAAGTTNSQDNQRMGPPDFSAAAKILGISEADLIAAFGDATQGPPNFAEIAKILGITEDELIKALESSNN